jgi:opacity protein-like surface antigen
MLCVLWVGVLAAPALAAVPRWGLYGSVMVPSDDEARKYAENSFGAGTDLSWPLHGTEGMLSAIAGFEWTNLNYQLVEFRDANTGLRVEQHTDQSYMRFYLGGELGPHGNGFLQPYANISVALVHYYINTNVVIPNDADPDNPLVQDVSEQFEFAFGWSGGAGVNFNFGRWGIDAGVRYLKQYGVPHQLGTGSVTVHPSYFQTRVGIAIPIRGRPAESKPGEP